MVKQYKSLSDEIGFDFNRLYMAMGTYQIIHQFVHAGFSATFVMLPISAAVKNIQSDKNPLLPPRII